MDGAIEWRSASGTAKGTQRSNKLNPEGASSRSSNLDHVGGFQALSNCQRVVRYSKGKSYIYISRKKELPDEENNYQIL